ncbi:SWPV2-ORF180 [Shearwaterpox virus]|uniref:mRNA-capping enzyme catalytic subunit n=1 Tax=Shearwaterpox virus TaxID=1974596 RepID=A0A1V0QGD5_CNPV|nr:SWPV2-ORF180 [Shearwaterpox virus]QRM15468.1 mRNA capping enzyme large subunit [Mudlarkpox virus]QRM15823.1 mRNA capping enzyme large subunit [Penguinpox virus 2]QRM16158.1 mRNA capping enzyme large subunit [Albatrosspox virus]
MDNYILEKPLGSHFEELVDTFFEAIRNVSEVDKSKHHEVEMQIFKPSIITLSNLYNISTTTESYIEFSMMPIDKKNTKYRNRIPLSKIHGLDIKNSQLVENLDGFIWEEKTLISEKRVSECTNIRIRHSVEQKTLFVDYKRRNGSIRLELVSVVRATLRNIVVDFKIKYFLGSGAQSASSLLYALNNPKNKPNLYLEFEISTSDKNISKQLLLNELNTIGNALFLSKVDKIRLCPRIKLVLKTYLLKKQEIINLNIENLYITSKTDGVFTYVLLQNKSIYCYFSHLGYIKEYTANREIDEKVYLYAEMRKENGILYFTVIKVLNPRMKNRLDELKFVNKNLQNINDRLVFVTKCYEGPFDSTSDLVFAIEEMLKYEHEGVIIFYSCGEESSLDYKIKKDNTIDQCVNVIYRYMSSEPVVFSDNGPFIEYKRYSDDKDFPKEFATGKLSLGNNVKYLNNIYCIEFTNLPEHTGVEKIIVPIKFIAEFSFNDKMIQPRIDKTMRYLYTENYYGNQLSVIIDHLNDQKINIGDVFEEDKLAEVAHKQLKDSLRLNPEGNYFIANKKRSALGVLSNYVKTLLISLYCSKAYLDDHSKRKVLAIDFGNGADLEKYFYGEIALMVATDPDEMAIETGKKRYNNLNSRDKSKYYKFNYIQETIRSPTYVDSIREVLYFGKFSIVDWQFAIHYSFHPIHYSTIMKNLYELTESGCKVLISTMDGDYLDTLKDKKKFIIYKSPETENYLSVEKIDNDKILVYNPSSMTKPMAEYIVRKDTLVRVFKEYQFSLIDNCSFKTIIDRSINFVKGVSRLETRDSTKNFLELNRNALEDCEGTDVLELLDHYMIYVFSKN